MEKQIQSGDLVVGLTVSQLTTLIGNIIRNSSPNKTEEPEYLTAPEAAAFLGYKLTTLRDMVHRRVIPFVKPEHGGRRIYFDRSKLIAWKSARKFQTNEEAFQNHLERASKKRRKAVMTKQDEIDFLRQNLREAKAFLKLWQFIHSLLRIQADKNHETGGSY